MRFLAVLLVGVAACSGGSGPASRPVPVMADLQDPMFDLSVTPRRPPMPSQATPDTNDPRAYYDAGVASLDTNPHAAAAAFFWAGRLDPSWAQPYFARWYILRHAAPATMSRSLKSQIDSLEVVAYMHDPFVDERLAMRDFSRQPGVRSWYVNFAEQRYDSASRELARLIPKYPDALEAYVYRAKATYYLGQYDTAAAILASAIGRIDAKESTRLLRTYVSSRPLFAYAMGVAYQQAHRDSAATAAFQKTLTENFGYYMAHLRLASEALAVHDTATALTETRSAAEIRPDDPVVQLFWGETLLSSHRAREAVEPLRAAIAADPYYALPYFYLGHACAAAHDTSASRAAYRGFLSHASRSDNLRKSAEEALAVLGSMVK